MRLEVFCLREMAKLLPKLISKSLFTLHGDAEQAGRKICRDLQIIAWFQSQQSLMQFMLLSFLANDEKFMVPGQSLIVMAFANDKEREGNIVAFQDGKDRGVVAVKAVIGGYRSGQAPAFSSRGIGFSQGTKAVTEPEQGFDLQFKVRSRNSFRIERTWGIAHIVIVKHPM